ncbi:MAG: carboxypeptidase-like regulatory domain-containing protein, partial [Ignavibacteriaceae bacterium]
MKKIVLSVFFLSTLLMYGQTTGKISGKVVDENNEPIIGVSISIEGTGLGAAADALGNFFIINIPDGAYNVKASAIGYRPGKVENVKVITGLTTKINFKLNSSSVEMKEVVVQYEKPMVQKDLTSKTQTIDFSDLELLPAQTSVKEILSKQAGITKDISTTPINSQPVFGQFATIPNDGLHFRGGRYNETLYLFDGITVNDALWGGYNLDVLGQFTLQSLQTLTGTFGPQYGEAMSGVILMQTLDNVVKKYKIQATSSTDNFGKKLGSQNENNFEAAVSGPVPLIDNLSFVTTAKSYMSDGYINGYIYPDFVDSRGTDKSGSSKIVPMTFRDSRLLFTKLIWQATDKIKLRIGYYNAETKQGVYD